MRERLDGARRRANAQGEPQYGCGYRRMRDEARDRRTQRFEVRFDGLSGALRMASGGGSSRQQILKVDDASVHSRLLTPREGARLMGLTDSYRLLEKKNDALDLVGDGVAVPVVRFLAANVLEPLLRRAPTRLIGVA
jgi:DNA (cytosine-5)-methyltransferase 1